MRDAEREAEGAGTVYLEKRRFRGILPNMYKYLMTWCKEDKGDSVVPVKRTRRNGQK